MTKLEKLYSIIENSREVGVKLSKDVLQQVEELEEGIIKEEILPALGNDIAPRLEPIKRDLVLVVEYHPGEPISVALSRKTKISEIMGAKTLTPRSSTPVKSEEESTEVKPHEPTKHIENTTKGMRVTFPDGTVIWHRQAIDTFIDALRKIGLECIPEVGIGWLVYLFEHQQWNEKRRFNTYLKLLSSGAKDRRRKARINTD